MISISPVVLSALISTSLISLAPNIILFLLPHNYSKSKKNQTLLSLGQALAAGGLLGDVFLHTLPHSISNSKNEIIVGRMVLIGFTVFLVLDMIVRISENSMKTKHVNKTKKLFSSTVILNLTADALHNFTDGLAIGVSFAYENRIGINSFDLISLLKSRAGFASISVMMHEIPHELGDFAILVSAGLTKWQAVKAQFITAIAAFFGTGVGLLLMQQKTTIGDDILMPLTAGGFVYIAACSILPELLEEKCCSIVKRILQLLSFCVGIIFMYCVSLLEEHDHDHHEL